MNNFRGTEQVVLAPIREDRNGGDRNAGDNEDDGINCLQETEGSNNEQNNNEGVNMLMKGASNVNPRSGKEKAKKLSYADATKHNSQSAHSGANNNNNSSDKDPECMHCGSTDHDLKTCPDITDAQLGEILVQLTKTDEGTRIEGGYVVSVHRH